MSLLKKVEPYNKGQSKPAKTGLEDRSLSRGLLILYFCRNLPEVNNFFTFFCSTKWLWCILCSVVAQAQTVWTHYAKTILTALILINITKKRTLHHSTQDIITNSTPHGQRSCVHAHALSHPLLPLSALSLSFLSLFQFMHSLFLFFQIQRWGPT